MRISRYRFFHLGLIGATFLLSLVFPHAVRATGNVPLEANLAVLGTNGVSIIDSGEAASKAKGTDFGVCVPGVLYTNTLYLFNNGNGPTLNFSSIVTNGSGFTIAGIPMSVVQSDKVPFTVVYGSATSGTNTADLVLNIQAATVFDIGVNSGALTAYTIKLAGSVGAPVLEISTNSGPFAGGNAITITNGNFGTITNVLVGGVRAALGAHGATWFTITLPATGSAGVKDLVVQTSDNGDITLAGAYTVNPAGVIGWTDYGPNVWTNLGDGMNKGVFALANDGVNLYAGGMFTNAGGVPAAFVAKWDAVSGAWTNLGAGMDNWVRALAYDGTNLYAGGDFRTAGGVSANYVAKWNGTCWTNLGPGVNGGVCSFAYNGTNLYAGGAFTTAGGVSANCVAKWDAASGVWTNLGLGMNSHVYALALDGVNLYAGGWFTYANRNPAQRVAMWNVASGAWSNLGSGVRNTAGLSAYVYALAHDGTNLYAGGNFTNAGGISANYMATWDAATGSWTNLGVGMDRQVNALAFDGANLYAGGLFTNAGGISANYVAKRDPASGAWTNLGAGMNSHVYALAHVGTNLYAGGYFRTAGDVPAQYVAQWGPTVTVNPGVAPASGAFAGGYTVTIIGSNLGNGSDITNVTICGVKAAVLPGQSATQVVVTAGISGVAGLGDVRVFSTRFGETVKSKAFTYLPPGLQVRGGNGAKIASGAGVSLLNGTQFAPIIPGAIVTNTFSITNNGTGLLTISGYRTNGTDRAYFSIAGIPATVPVGGVSPFTVAYSPAAAGSHTAALVISNDSSTASYTVNLAGSCCQLSAKRGPFAGGNTITITNGNFGNITNVLVGGVRATLGAHGANGFTITLPATGSAGVKDIVVQTSDNGTITLAGAYTVNLAGRIGVDAEPSAWTNLGAGVNDAVYALVPATNNVLYVGGLFSKAGGSPANYVAQWNGSSWTNLGSGMNNYVYALAGSTNAVLYAGGWFTTAGDVAVNHIAQWNGSSWTNLSSGMNGEVYALALDVNGNVYAGGNFTTAGDVSANGIAKWNGSTWTNLGLGVNGNKGQIRALALDGNGNVYVGGDFTTAGGVLASNIAKWNGSTWTNLGSGMSSDSPRTSGDVRGLALAPGGVLYAAGNFVRAGGVTVNYVAQWSGNSWTNLGSGMNHGMRAVELDTNGNVTAAGYFTTAGSVAANYVAEWNGSSWTNMGSGMDHVVEELAVGRDNVLYAGGYYTTADGVAANNVAKRGPAGTANPGVSPSSGSYTGGYTVTIIGSNLGAGSDITNVTICGVKASVLPGQSSTQVVVTAGISSVAGLGDVRVFSTRFGETVKRNAFEYLGDPSSNVIAALTDKVEVTVPEGGTASFRVKLSAKSTGDVVVAVARESGDSSLTVSNGARLIFTPANWATYQRVTLAAAEDNADNVDGITVFAITAAGIGSAKVVATEADDDYTLEVTHTNGAVKINGNTRGKNQSFYDHGTVVTLTAMPNKSYQFSEWFDDATGTDNPLELTMDGDKNVAAWFVPAPPKSLPPRTIARKAFTARWQWVAGGAPEGELSVASDAGFANRVPGYEKLYVCNITECSVSNLVANRDYWYRVRRLTALSGKSVWSKAMKVRTGLGMPVFTSLLFGGPVDQGPCQEYALTNLVSGAGELSVKSSDTNNVDVVLTENALFLRYLWRGPEATARLTLTLTHPETGYKAAYQVELSEANGSVVVVETGALTNAGKRLSQDVTIENRTGAPLYGVRVRAEGLDNPEWMRNRTGVGMYTADPILEIPCVLPAGSQLVVRVLYHSDYAKQARKRPVDYRAIAVVAPLNELQPELFGLPLAQNAVYESDEGMRLLGLPVIGNRLFVLGHSDDGGVNWNTNAPAIRATANYLMWLDLEAASNRLYQVLDAGK